MLFLLAVVLAAVRHGRGPAVLASLLGVVSFDFFFVEPRLSFAVSDVQYLLTFFVMLIVGLITGQLTAGPALSGARRGTARSARARAVRARARAVRCAACPSRSPSISNRFVQSSFGAKAALLLMSEQDKLLPPIADADALEPSAVDMGIAQWVFEHGEPAGFGTDTLPGSPVLYLPLQSADAHARRARGAAVQSALAAGAGAAPADRSVRGARRSRAGARALRGYCAEGAGADGIGAAAQFAAVGRIARSAHAADRSGRPGRYAALSSSRRCRGASAKSRRRSARRPRA